MNITLVVGVDEGHRDVVTVEHRLTVGKDVLVDHVRYEIPPLYALRQEVDAVLVLVGAHEGNDEGAPLDDHQSVALNDDPALVLPLDDAGLAHLLEGIGKVWVRLAGHYVDGAESALTDDIKEGKLIESYLVLDFLDRDLLHLTQGGGLLAELGHYLGLACSEIVLSHDGLNPPEGESVKSPDDAVRRALDVALAIYAVQ